MRAVFQLVLFGALVSGLSYGQAAVQQSVENSVDSSVNASASRLVDTNGEKSPSGARANKAHLSALSPPQADASRSRYAAAFAQRQRGTETPIGIPAASLSGSPATRVATRFTFGSAGRESATSGPSIMHPETLPGTPAATKPVKTTYRSMASARWSRPALDHGPGEHGIPPTRQHDIQ